jgi:hypothetical protein
MHSKIRLRPYILNTLRPRHPREGREVNRRRRVCIPSVDRKDGKRAFAQWLGPELIRP